MKSLLTAVVSAPLMVIGSLFVFAPRSLGQTQAMPPSDFASAVQAGVQSSSANPETQFLQQRIQNQDYQSAWDEFGINVLVDGSMPPAEVNSQITQDIIQSVETVQSYDQEEARYLEAAQVTPEQVQAIEDSAGSDIPPDQSIDPNPSVDANPDVSTSPIDVPPENNAEDNATTTATTTTTTTTAEEASTSVENGSSTIDVGVAMDMSATTTDMGSAADTSASSSEDMIYNAILQGEQTHPVDQTSSIPESAAQPADVAPPADAAPPAP